MSTQTKLYTRLMEKGATKLTPIPGQPGPENIDNLEYEVARVMETENTALYNMVNKFGFWAIIIGKNCNWASIGDNKWEFFDTDNPVPYDENVIMDGTADINGAQHIQLESSHIRNIKNDEKFLVANR